MTASKALRSGIPLPTLPDGPPVRRVPLLLALGGAVLFLGIYTEIPLSIGAGGTIPMISALPGLLLLLAWPGTWSMRLVLFVVLPSLAFFILSLCSIQFEWEFGNRVNAFAQFFISLLIGYIASNVLIRLGNERVFKVVSFILPLFCMLIILEIATPFKDLTTNFLNLFPREYDLISLNNRDAGMGGYRPKLFTSETSYVAMSAVILITAYLWLGSGVKKYIMALGYTLVLTVLIRSPTVALSLPILLVTIATDRTVGRMRPLHTATLLLLAVVSGVGLITFGSEIIKTRLEKVTSGADYSTTYRTYGSIEAGWNVADQYPLFGVGPGSIDKAKDIIISTQIHNSVPERAIVKEWRVSMSNAFGSMLMYFGYIGSSFVIIAVMILILMNVPPSRLPVFTGFIFLCFTYGAIYTPKFVATFIIIVALAKMRAGNVIESGSMRSIPKPISATDKGIAGRSGVQGGAN